MGKSGISHMILKYLWDLKYFYIWKHTIWNISTRIWTMKLKQVDCIIFKFSYIENKNIMNIEEKYTCMCNRRKKDHFKMEDAFSLLKVYLCWQHSILKLEWSQFLLLLSCLRRGASLQQPECTELFILGGK